MNAALKSLGERIRAGVTAGTLPKDYLTLLDQVERDLDPPFIAEPVFRRLTGSSDGWCVRHFEACKGAGLAELRGKRRWWSPRARVRPLGDPALEEQIVRSLTKDQAA